MLITNGVLPIFKPAGISSFDCIRVIKKNIHPKKIGHAGTLDLPAGGVLLLTLGEGTKAFPFLTDCKKEYETTVQFGAATFSDDAEGEIIKRSDVKISKAQVESALPEFIGEIVQLSPKVSALKQGGKRSYELIRENKEAVQKERTVSIYEIQLLDFDFENQTAKLRILCGSGTYIRSIARDLGGKLGSLAHVKTLVRTQSAGVRLSDCAKLEEITPENIENLILPLNRVLSSYSELKLGEQKDFIFNGKILSGSSFENPPNQDGIYRVTKDDMLLAMIEKKDSKFNYLRVFRT